MNINNGSYEVGIVRFTRPARGERWWGILDTPKGQVWFGSEYRRTIYLNPLFGNIAFGWWSSGECPRQNSRIAFIREISAPGKYRAQVWGRHEDFEAAAQKLAADALEATRQREAKAREVEARSKLPIYRVIQITLWKGRPTTNAENIVAEGVIPDLSLSASPRPRPVLDFDYRYRIERREKENVFTPRGVTPAEMAAISQTLNLPQAKLTPGFSEPTPHNSKA